MNQKVRACVISPEVVGPHKNGGIGTHSFYLASFLSRDLGQEVTFLYTGGIEVKDEAYWKDWFRSELGIEFAWIQPQLPAEAIPFSLRCEQMSTTRRVYDWLRAREFDVCHFQEMLGNGFRSFQAKKLGLAFSRTLLTCTVHSAWEWICQAMQALPHSGMHELQTKFMERYSTRNCDVLISPSQYMLDWVEGEQIRTRAPKFVLPYLFDPRLQPVGHRPCADHVIFFGRLEVRKGLLVFLEALLRLDQSGALAGRKLKVTFLGKPGYTPDGGGAISVERYRSRFSRAIHVEEVPDLDQPGALKYLAAHNDALVVCPSLIDNSPYAIIESLQLGLNLIAAGTGGIPELFADHERLFRPEPDELAARLVAGLEHKLPPLAKRYDRETSARLWREFCTHTLPTLASQASGSQAGLAGRVQVFVAAPSSEQETKRLEDSFKAQTFRDFCVSVVPQPGGGETAAGRDDLRAACAKNGWELLAEPRADSPTPERGESGGDGDALFLAHGCIPHPQMFETLVRARQASGADALAACLEVEGESGQAFLYEPLGPCLEGGFLAGVFGAGCLLVGREMAPRGFPEWQALVSPSGIWRFLAQLASAGKTCDVVPDLLGRLGRDVPLTALDLPYPDLMKLVGVYANPALPWQRDLFTSAIGNEGRVRKLAAELRKAEQETEAISSLAPGKILYKIQREARRFIKQCQSLSRRMF